MKRSEEGRAIPLPARTVDALVQRHGGRLRNGARGTVRRFVPITRAGSGDLTVLLHARYAEEAVRAASRGALLLVDEALAKRAGISSLPAWSHPHAGWAMAEILDSGEAPADAPIVGADCLIGPGVHLLPRVEIGSGVTIGAGAVIGAPGFGWVNGPGGETRDVPQLGGVIIEDDVYIGPLCTIAAGTIGPTILRRGVKLDAQVHVGHNCEIGEGTIIAAQTGLAGSVTIGRGVLVGGQVGVADHVVIGDGARLAAKSGVIGDVPPGETVGGYPAVPRMRWLRGLAGLYRLASRKGAARRTLREADAEAHGEARAGASGQPPTAHHPSPVANTIPAPPDPDSAPLRLAGLHGRLPRIGIPRNDPPEGDDRGER